MGKYVITEIQVLCADGKYHTVKPFDFDSILTDDTVVRGGKGNVNNLLDNLIYINELFIKKLLDKH
jgi:hypothetical protein